mmetsp:Transcript_2994/g.8179  ORF Transcript_2994/g.8179 Transcript_2994/m.8179 type:complete len:119 (-) Transcript_2994:467-823(-)
MRSSGPVTQTSRASVRKDSRLHFVTCVCVSLTQKCSPSAFAQILPREDDNTHCTNFDPRYPNTIRALLESKHHTTPLLDDDQIALPRRVLCVRMLSFNKHCVRSFIAFMAFVSFDSRS